MKNFTSHATPIENTRLQNSDSTLQKREDGRNLAHAQNSNESKRAQVKQRKDDKYTCL